MLASRDIKKGDELLICYTGIRQGLCIYGYPYFDNPDGEDLLAESTSSLQSVSCAAAHAARILQRVGLLSAPCGARTARVTWSSR